jgi:hypothetical protein
VFLVALWYAIVSGKLIVIGLGALALVAAGLCAMAYWPAEVPERRELGRGTSANDRRPRPRRR